MYYYFCFNKGTWALFFINFSFNFLSDGHLQFFSLQAYAVLLLLIREGRDTVSYFNTWNLYGLKGEYGNVWKLPSRAPSLFLEPVFHSRACTSVSRTQSIRDFWSLLRRLLS